MGRILIFEDIVNDLSERQRDVTLIGEENLISCEKGCDKDYDLYYYYFNGIKNINLDAKFRQIPVFLNPEIQIIKNYHEKHRNDGAGFYSIDKKLLLCDYDSLKAFEENFKKAGLEGRADFSVIKREKLFKRLRDNGIANFEEEIREKCEYLKNIKNHAV